MSIFLIGNFVFNFYYLLIFNLGFFFFRCAWYLWVSVFYLGCLYKFVWVWERVFDLLEDEIYCLFLKESGEGESNDFVFLICKFFVKGKL